MEKCLFLKIELKICTENRFPAYIVSLRSATGEFEYDAFKKCLWDKKKYLTAAIQNMSADSRQFLGSHKEIWVWVGKYNKEYNWMTII